MQPISCDSILSCVCDPFKLFFVSTVHFEQKSFMVVAKLICVCQGVCQFVSSSLSH